MRWLKASIWTLGLLLGCAWSGLVHVESAWASAACAGDFSGRWNSTFGIVTLTQTGDHVEGNYTYGAGGTIKGDCKAGKLVFTYLEAPSTTGEGTFELEASGTRFKGAWRETGQTAWGKWDGTKESATATASFDGLFDTNFGRMRLVRDGDNVTGLYSGKTSGTISGKVSGTKLTFTWKESSSEGDGWFEESAGGAGVAGQWRVKGDTKWGDWKGTRTVPMLGVKWLIILETQWETSLIEPEYAFGDMLRSYFERIPNVQVRHRRIQQREDLTLFANDLALIAEPVALWLSGHGDESGLSLEGTPIDHTVLAPALLAAPNVFIVHFASCAVMGGDVPKKLRAAIPSTRALAISGYATPVDWSASAVLEILYLDLLLARGASPATSVATIKSEMNFAGDTPTKDSPFGALKLRLIE